MLMPLNPTALQHVIRGCAAYGTCIKLQLAGSIVGMYQHTNVYSLVSFYDMLKTQYYVGLAASLYSCIIKAVDWA